MQVSEITHAMNDDQSWKYRWVAFIDRLADGDITKHDEIYRIKIVHCGKNNIKIFYYCL